MSEKEKETISFYLSKELVKNCRTAFAEGKTIVELMTIIDQAAPELEKGEYDEETLRVYRKQNMEQHTTIQKLQAEVERLKAEIITLKNARRREKNTLRKKQKNAQRMDKQIRNIKKALKVATDYLKEWRDYYKKNGKHQQYEFRDKLEEIEQALQGGGRQDDANTPQGGEPPDIYDPHNTKFQGTQAD